MKKSHSGKRQGSLPFGQGAEPHVASDLCRGTQWVASDQRNRDIFDLFEADPSLLNLPVVEGEQIIGLINRHSFMRNMVRRYHWEIYSGKRCSKIMEDVPLIVEADTPIQELASGLLNADAPEHISAGFIIVRQGRLLGTGLTSDVLAAMLLLERRASDDLREQTHLLNTLVEERTRALGIAQRNEEKQRQENVLAKGIIDRLTLRHGRSDTRLHYWLQPAENFSGDTVASARSPDGVLYALLADATGHGLTAAITVVPVLTLFYRLVEENRPIDYIATQLNRELRETMPVGRFVAASLAAYDHDRATLSLWQGGMPHILHFDAGRRLKAHYASPHPPLGILDNDRELADIRPIAVNSGDLLLFFSDGLIEADNAVGEPFGLDRITAALPQAGRSAAAPLAAIQDALWQHLGGSPPHDDISLLTLHCRAGH